MSESHWGKSKLPIFLVKYSVYSKCSKPQPVSFSHSSMDTSHDVPSGHPTWLENPPFMDDFPNKTSIYRETEKFPITPGSSGTSGASAAPKCGSEIPENPRCEEIWCWKMNPYIENLMIPLCG